MADPIGAALRPASADEDATLWFRSQMLLKLRLNANKAGWDTVSQRWLLNRLRQEVGELARAVEQYEDDADAANVIFEAADVANFAMMIADNARHGL